MQTLLCGKEILRRPPYNCLNEDMQYFPTQYDAPDVYMETIPHARVDGDGVLRTHFFTDMRSYAEKDIFRRMGPLKKIRAIVNPLYYFFRREGHLENGIYIINNWTACYFHWFCDALPRLLLIKDQVKDVPILLPERNSTVDSLLLSVW